MFNRRDDEQLEALRKEIKELRSKVEAMNQPIHFGEWPSYAMYFPGDPRPSISHEEAILLLMKHCGVEFEQVQGTPTYIALRKKAKPHV